MKKIGFIALAILALSSCADDSGIDNALTSNLGIAFNTSTFAIGENSQTRAEHSEEPIILQDNNNNAALYLHLSVEENTLTKTSLDTRSTPVTGSNFQTIYKSFGVSAYTPEGTVFMDNVNVGNYNNPVWTPTDRVYFWPNDYALDFYAYAPYPAKTTDLELNKAKGEVSFSYTTPKGTASNDAIAQPDLLFAYGNGSLEEHKNGTMPLKFSHALSAIKFVAKDINVGTTIQSISIKNVYGEGDCVAYPNADPNAGTNPYKWTTRGTATSYSQTFDVTINETGRQEITDVDPEKTFMMIPQTLGDDAEIEVVVKPSDGEPITLTGSLTGQEWKAGNLYTYAISTESINWIYVFNVTEALTIEGFSTGEYNVKSYKYRAGREEEKVAVAWSATVDGEEDKQYVTQFTYSGEGAASGDGTNYPIALMHTALTSSWPGDATLRSNDPKGTTDDPYDLSTDGGTTQTTANCYIVDAAGTYKLPLVYGNAIKNGVENAAAYGDSDKNKVFLNYENEQITSPDITGADNCTLVWSDAFYMFKDVKISDDDKYLIFTIDRHFMQQANAVLAVRDSANRIMWSWHIWVTEHPINTSIELDDREDASIKYGMMPYPLGWIDPKVITYKKRNLTFYFTQDGGKTATMDVEQPGKTLEYTDDGSVYYQWGRKDPLIGLKKRQTQGGDDFRPHQTGAAKYSYKYEGGNTVGLGTAIQNPNIFYSPNDAPRSWHDSQPKHYLWDSSEGDSDATKSTKTIYDPSPKGYKVPPRRAFAIFVTKDKQGENVGELNGTQDGYKYTVYSKSNKQGNKITLVATGQRADRERLGSTTPGGLWAMYGVYYWSCYADYNGSEYYGYSLCIRNDKDGDAKNFYTSKFVGAQSMARPVRPIKE